MVAIYVFYISVIKKHDDILIDIDEIRSFSSTFDLDSSFEHKKINVFI